MKNQQVHVEGTVLEIVFTNEQNGYTVCTIDCSDSEVTAVGTMPGITPGESVRIYGTWTSHADYGEQIRVSSFEKITPSTAEQIFLYLSSGIIKGVGPATAKKIVEKFGEQSLLVIQNEPRRLSEIRGISLDKALSMQASYLEKQSVQNVIMFFQSYGVTLDFALKVYNRFGSSAPEKVKENPYILCDIEGIGFKTADKIASSIGTPQNDENRLKSGILYVLNLYSQSGHTYLAADSLKSLSCQVLGCDAPSVDSAFASLVLSGLVVRQLQEDCEAIYLPSLYNSEVSVARRIVALSRDIYSPCGSDFEKAMESVSAKINIELSAEQEKVCRLAMENSAVIVTGGPGTGKTTVMKAIISLMNHFGHSVALAAPTGRAAKRLSEACGIEAKTIHRLLEINFSGDDQRHYFTRDESFPLDEDTVIIDEMSMVDITLMNALLKALRPGTRLIMAGDADQLPSVGPGNVLKDIIESDILPTVRLTQIYRQAAESMITVNAHRINRGEYPILNDTDKDFFFISRPDGRQILETLTDVVSRRLPVAYGYDAFSDIQVISPTRKTPLGVYEINKKLQQVLNPPSQKKNEKQVGDTVFREGDKVMQIRNNYNIAWDNILTGESGNGAFNGDLGIIQNISLSSQTLSVLFDGERLINYSFDSLADLELSYAVTVHKSQGNEFNAVVLPLYRCAPRLMTRNIFYTALTRAKNLVVLIGSEEVMKKMIQNTGEYVRFSGLLEKIKTILDSGSVL